MNNSIIPTAFPIPNEGKNYTVAENIPTENIPTENIPTANIEEISEVSQELIIYAVPIENNIFQFDNIELCTKLISMKRTLLIFVFIDIFFTILNSFIFLPSLILLVPIILGGICIYKYSVLSILYVYYNGLILIFRIYNFIIANNIEYLFYAIYFLIGLYILYFSLKFTTYLSKITKQDIIKLKNCKAIIKRIVYY